MLNILILGSSGFLGERLTHHIRKVYARVNLATFCRSENGDYQDRAALQKALKGQHLVYNLISASFPASSWENPYAELEGNLRPFIQFLELARIEGIKKIVFCSSGGTVYGVQDGVVSEERAPNPFSPHGIAKLTMEKLLEYARVRDGINYDIFRLTNPYGPNQKTFRKGLGVIATWLHQLIGGQEITVFGDGEIVRDFIYVDDAVALMALSTIRPLTDNHVLNLASGQRVTLNQLIEVIGKVINRRIPVRYVAQRKNDNPSVLLSNERVLRYAGGSYCFMDLQRGIHLTWESLRR